MNDRIRTLVLFANNGPSKKRVAADTILRGLLKIPDDYQPPRSICRFKMGQNFAKLFQSKYHSLGYVYDWLDAIKRSPLLEVNTCNITNLFEFQHFKKNIAGYDLIMIMHSALGDTVSFLLKTAHWLLGRRGKLIAFIGNEYDLMQEKIDFLHKAGVEYICSQLPISTAQWLYADCKSAQVIPMPHALNSQKYRAVSHMERDVDLGFIGAEYPIWIGDLERNEFFRKIRSTLPEMNISSDIRVGNVNLPAEEWAIFLGRCKNILGAESGSYYLDRQGDILSRAKAYVNDNPSASFDEVFEKCFKSIPIEYRSGKCISSRHFEPIGTKTCQVMLEGDYNGILKPGEHYFSVKKDFSNLEEILKEFQDETRRRQMAETAYSYVMDGHTYDHRIRFLIDAVQ